MKDYIIHHEWKIVEEGFVPEFNRISESIFSIGNGKMGQRANFEEKYSGDSLNGTYVAGIYYPDNVITSYSIHYTKLYDTILQLVFHQNNKPVCSGRTNLQPLQHG